MRRPRLIGALVGGVVVIAGCGGGDGGTPPPPPPPPVASVDISPNTGQSMVVGGTVAFTATPRNAQGAAVSGQTINWTTSNGAAVSLSATTGASVTANGAGAGSSDIRAAVGTVQSNPIRVSVAASCTAGASPCATEVAAGANSDTFTPASASIAVGGTVTWTFGQRTHNVVFDSPKPSGVADIGNSSNTTVSRTFRVAGTYGYDCSLHPGMSGTIIVQ